MQTCILHLIRASLRYVNYEDRKKVVSVLRAIYTAANANDALIELERFEAEWGMRYPPTAQAWRRDWQHVSRFCRCPTSCAARSIPPTPSRDVQKRSRLAGTSRRAGRYEADLPRAQCAPMPNGNATAPGQHHAQPGRSTSETDSQADHQHVAPASHTVRRTAPR